MLCRELPQNLLKSVYRDSDSNPFVSLPMRVDAVTVHLENFQLEAKIYAALLAPELKGADVVVDVKIAEESSFSALCALTNGESFVAGEFSKRKYFGYAHLEVNDSYKDQEFESLQIELHLLPSEWRKLKEALDDGITQRDTKSTLGVRIQLPVDYENTDIANLHDANLHNATLHKALKVFSIWVETLALYSQDAPYENYALRAELRGC